MLKIVNATYRDTWDATDRDGNNYQVTISF